MSTHPIVKSIGLGRLIRDEGTQPRMRLDTLTVHDYMDAIDAGATFPPVDVFFDGSLYYLADGFHRWEAHSQKGIERIKCAVHRGSVDDARWFALAANKVHGLPRSTADKARAVKAALLHPKGASLSDSQIAEHVGVAVNTVCKYRKEAESTLQIAKSDSRTGKDGRTINTSNIGRRAVDPPEVEGTKVNMGKSGDGFFPSMPDPPPTCHECGSTLFDDGTCRACLPDDAPKAATSTPDDPDAELVSKVVALVETHANSTKRHVGIVANKVRQAMDKLC